MDRSARAERLKLALFFGRHREVQALLSRDPGLGRANLGLACALYDLPHLREVLSRDPSAALAPVAGPREPLLHLAASQHFKGGGDRLAMMLCAEALVAAGADVNASYPVEPGSADRLSALYCALGHAGNLELAAWLLDHGASPNDGESLYHATELGHLDGLRLLLRHGATIAGTNALLRMLDFDDLEGVRLLLQAGADPNEGKAAPEPERAVLALHQAARRMCSGEIASLLLAHGADGSARYLGHTAYALARIHGNRPVAAVLEAAGYASALDPAETVLARAAEGAVAGQLRPEDLTDETRRSLVRVLGQSPDLGHVQRLVAVGIDPDWTDEMGLPALHVAGWEGHAEITEWLLTLGPDLGRTNAFGGDALSTILHGAEFCPARDRRDHLRCLRAVLEAGAPLRQAQIDTCPIPEIAAVLKTWAARHPARLSAS